MSEAIVRRPKPPAPPPCARLQREGALALGIVLAAFACSALESDDAASAPSKEAQDDGDMSAAQPAAGGAAQTPTPDPDPTLGTPQAPCSIGARAAGCCLEFEARLRTEAEADPCWFEFPGMKDPAESARFRDCSGPLLDCGSVQCGAFEPPSRLAGLVTSPAQACTFADECRTDTDCALAFDGSQTCPCPRSTPSVLIDEHPCQLPVGTPPSEIPELCHPARGTAVSCEPCPEASAPRCVLADGLRRCE